VLSVIFSLFSFYRGPGAIRRAKRTPARPKKIIQKKNEGGLPPASATAEELSYA